jgi:hypothetical protein
MHAAHFWILMITLSPVGLAMFASASMAADKTGKTSSGIVKWVDDKGVTHYGDSLPPQYSGRDNSVMNSQGVTIRHNEAVNRDQKLQSQATLDQQRRDRALLATFSNKEEIDLARDRNIQMDKTALQGLQQRMESAKQRLAANQKAARVYEQRRQPLPADLARDLKDNQADIAKIEDQIAQRKKNMAATQNRFDEDKRRFIELKSAEPATTSSRQSNP